jgi:hypothetical protein
MERNRVFLTPYLLPALGVLSLGLGVDKPREGVWYTTVSREWRGTGSFLQLLVRPRLIYSQD